MQDINFRTYFKCIELKSAGIDWKHYLVSEFKINILVELAIQLSDLPQEERNARWITETGKSIRTLQRILKKHKYYV